MIGEEMDPKDSVIVETQPMMGSTPNSINTSVKVLESEWVLRFYPLMFSGPDELLVTMKQWVASHPHKILSEMHLDPLSPPFLISVTRFLNDRPLQFLLQECFEKKVEIEKINYKGSNVLHWIMGTSIQISEWSLFQKMVDHGFPVAAPDPTEESLCSAAMLALSKSKVEGFKFCIAAYTDQEWEKELPLFKKKIEDRNRPSSWKNRYADIIAKEEARRLARAIVDQGSSLLLRRRF